MLLVKHSILVVSRCISSIHLLKSRGACEPFGASSADINRLMLVLYNTYLINKDLVF